MVFALSPNKITAPQMATMVHQPFPLHNTLTNTLPPTTPLPSLLALLSQPLSSSFLKSQLYYNIPSHPSSYLFLFPVIALHSLVLSWPFQTLSYPLIIHPFTPLPIPLHPVPSPLTPSHHFLPPPHPLNANKNPRLPPTV